MTRPLLLCYAVSNPDISCEHKKILIFRRYSLLSIGSTVCQLGFLFPLVISYSVQHLLLPDYSVLSLLPYLCVFINSAGHSDSLSSSPCWRLGTDLMSITLIPISVSPNLRIPISLFTGTYRGIGVSIGPCIHRANVLLHPFEQH